MNQLHDYYECGMCLIFFKAHHNQAEHCNLCYKNLLSFKDLEDTYIYPLEDNE